jgi:hypothetical protein
VKQSSDLQTDKLPADWGTIAFILFVLEI